MRSLRFQKVEEVQTIFNVFLNKQYLLTPSIKAFKNKCNNLMNMILLFFIDKACFSFFIETFVFNNIKIHLNTL